LGFCVATSSHINLEGFSSRISHPLTSDRALFPMTTTFALTALGSERLNECDKNSKQQQEMYQKESKNNPFHALASRSVLS